MAENETCSKCSGELDTRGYPKWCKSCRAKYKREYEDTREEMISSQSAAAGKREGREEGYAMGFGVAKNMVAARFAAMGGRVLSAAEAAAIVQKVGLP